VEEEKGNTNKEMNNSFDSDTKFEDTPDN